MTGLGYAVRRLAIGVALLFVLATATFWIDRAITYDPGAYLLRDIRHPTNEQIARANHLLGADGSVLGQYGHFVAGLVRGDLGVSWQTATLDRAQGFVAEPVGPIVLHAAAVTGSLALGGGLLLLLLAVPGGTWLAARAGTWVDRTTLLVALAAISTHPLVLGNVLQLVFGERLGWLPETGYCPLLSTTGPEGPGFGPGPTVEPGCGGPVDWASHLVLPWISFAVLLVALHLRQMHASAVSVLAEPYVQAARAKGVRERSVLLRHVLPNALPPVVTSVAADTGAALGVALYVEVVFDLPGLGYRFLVAIQGTVGFDRPVIVGIVLVVGAVVVVANLVADLLVAALDPRVRLGRGGHELLGSGD